MEIHHESNSTKNLILFRDKETAFLERFAKKKLSFQYRSLYVYGNTSTGKTLVVSNILQKHGVPFVWINCHECYSSQLIFTFIVNKLSKSDDYKKISNVCEFINFIKIHLKGSWETTYLVFDCVDVLRKEMSILMPVLVNLQNLTKCNICSIFISELSWDEIRTQIISVQPITLHFPSYSKAQLCDILSQDCPEEYSMDFYSAYINVILRTFYTVTRNLAELRHLAQVNFEKYCEPLNKDPDEELSSLRLWKNIEPTLKEAMRSVYLREVSKTKWRTICKNENIVNKISNSSNCSLTRELPFYSKFLLLAAYFASYNPPKSDFKHFVKNQGKQGKKRITKKVEKNRHLLGPKPFSLDRLLSIFFSIVGESVLPSALIFSQISSLVHMRLMARVSVDEQLDCPKYKCLAELDLVCKIGKTVCIDVMGYLDDFL